MKIKSVAIDNFLVIGSAVLNLEDKGLVLVQGENKDDDSADSNGAGKSSIVDSISWCLYGETARGVKGDAVVNRKAKKDCCVSAIVDDDGTKYGISRYRKDKEHKNALRVVNLDTSADLTKGTDKLTQDVVNKIVGCSVDVFKAAIYSGQENMPNLPGMTDRQLKLLIEEAAGIERLQRAHETAKERLKSVETKYINAIANVEIKIKDRDGVRIMLDESIEDKRSWDEDTAGEIDSRSRSMADRAKIYMSQKKIIDGMNEEGIVKEMEKLSEALDGKEREDAERERLSDIAASADRTVASVAAKASVQAKRTRSLKESLDNIQSKVGTPCGECGKTHTMEDIEDARDLASKKLRESIELVKQANVSLTDARNEQAERIRELEMYESSMTDVSEVLKRQRDLTQSLDEINKKKQVLKSAAQDVKTEKNEIARLKAKVNPHESRIKSRTDSLKAAEIAIEEANKNVVEVEDEATLKRNAVEVFGPAGVRAHILDSVTPFLNEKTAHYLGSLTDGGISATWSTLSTTAKGELREKFAIAVEKVNGASTFAGLSGGEKRKVRLATSMALQDLVASRATKPFQLYVADEIDDALDGAGLERLMGILDDKAKDRGTVLVISHNSLSDWISQQVTVRNESGVSTVSGVLS